MVDNGLYYNEVYISSNNSTDKERTHKEGEVERTSNILHNINSQVDVNHIPEGETVRPLVPVDLELGNSWTAC